MLRTRKGKIADRDHPLLALLADSVAVGERIKLLDIAELMVSLLFHPGPEAELKGTMTKLERTRGQGVGWPHGENTRLLIRHRHDHCDQIHGSVMGSVW